MHQFTNWSFEKVFQFLSRLWETEGKDWSSTHHILLHFTEAHNPLSNSIQSIPYQTFHYTRVLLFVDILGAKLFVCLFKSDHIFSLPYVWAASTGFFIPGNDDGAVALMDMASLNGNRAGRRVMQTGNVFNWILHV